MAEQGKTEQAKKNDFYEYFIQKLQQSKSSNLRTSFVK